MILYAFYAVTILLTRCVKEAGKSFHIATSASSFLEVQGTPAMLVAIFESKLDVTCFNAGFSLVVWMFLVACRAFTAHLRENKQLPSRKCNNMWKISNMFDPCNCFCMCWKLCRSPPHTMQQKERFGAILIACIENCMLSQRSAVGFLMDIGYSIVGTAVFPFNYRKIVRTHFIGFPWSLDYKSCRQLHIRIDQVHHYTAVKKANKWKQVPQILYF